MAKVWGADQADAAKDMAIDLAETAKVKAAELKDVVQTFIRRK